MVTREGEPTQSLRPTHVRFRSRVRITSGFRRHRRESSLHQAAIDHDLFGYSPGSSLSGSASSSISAPLRTRADEEVGKPGWGTLGQRVRLLAQNNTQRRKSREAPETKHNTTNEHTPLIWSTACPSYVNVHYNSLVHEDSEEPRISRRIEPVFGTWPGRLLNHRVCSKMEPSPFS